MLKKKTCNRALQTCQQSLVLIIQIKLNLFKSVSALCWWLRGRKAIKWSYPLVNSTNSTSSAISTCWWNVPIRAVVAWLSWGNQLLPRFEACAIGWSFAWEVIGPARKITTDIWLHRHNVKFPSKCPCSFLRQKLPSTPLKEASVCGGHWWIQSLIGCSRCWKYLENGSWSLNQVLILSLLRLRGCCGKTEWCNIKAGRQEVD